MLDLVWFVLWCVPILTGLLFVVLSLKARSRAVVVPVSSADPHSSRSRRGR
jgi:hypothetical protein